MKNWMRMMAVVMAVVCLMTCLSGCSGSKTGTAGEVNELSVFLFMSPTPYSPDMPIWKAAAEKTGITLKNVVSSVASSEGTAYATMLAGNELPDIIRHFSKDLRILAADGGLRPLNDLIDEYAPNIKEFFEKVPEAKELASIDGEIYFVPGTLGGMDVENAPATGFMIRQDWMDKLGLKHPTTIDEFYQVLKAFKTQDPNGNGMADEVPYFYRSKNIAALLYLWEASNDFILNNGKLEYSATGENYKIAMKELAKWYKEGLIDQEIFSRSSAREQLFGQNMGGCTSDWFSSTAKFNDTLKDSIPGFNLQGMMPPANIEGEVQSRGGRARLHNWAWGISVDCDEEKLVDAIKYMDFWMSKEGSDLMANGVEGVSYTLDENGKKVWTEAALSYDSGVPNYLRSIGTTEVGYNGDLEAEKSAMNEAGLNAYIMYEPITLAGIGTIVYTTEEQEIMDEVSNNIKTAVSEQQQKWLFGKEDVDATWDKYVETLNNMGLQKYIDTYTAAYNRLYGDK